MPNDRLTLLGHDAADLTAISALLQDAIVRPADIGFDQRARRLVLVVTRFRHETQRPSRVRSFLRIETVGAVQRRNWPGAPGTMLSLLAVTCDDHWLEFCFSGGAALRARIEVIDVLLEDGDSPWPTDHIPVHADQ